MNVLIVDDNVDSAEAMGDVVRSWGHEVAVAFNGHAALAAAEAHPPDVIFLDIGLPGLDGYTVARRLRTDDRFRSTRLIAMTGFDRPADRARSMAAGFDGHLGKPVSMDQLARALALR